MSAVSMRLCGKKTKGSVYLLAVIMLLALLTACGGVAKTEFSYKAPFLPFSLVFRPPDHWSISGDQSFATPIGEFSIGAEYELPQHDSASIYVILRNRSTGYDRIFEVKTGGEQFSAVVNGTTIITITHDQVLIDVTRGNIQKITFKRVKSQISEATSASWFTRTWHSAASRWDEGWRQSWYKPFALSRWAYSDSTIEKWYGAGFVLFLLRFILAIALGVVDAVLSLGFVLGQLAFLVFGPTGRDVTYGFLVLGVLFLIGAGIASEW